MNKRLAKQRGVALISVLFVVALTVIIAVEMSGRLQLQMLRTTNINGARQAYWYAIGAEQLAKQMIARINSEKDNRSSTIHAGQDWSQQGLNYPVDGGTIGGELKDLQSCFNLNSLAQDPLAETKSNNQNASTPTPNSGGGLKPVENNGRKEERKTLGDLSAQRRKGIPFAMEAFTRLLQELGIDEISDVPPEYLAQRLKDFIDADSRLTGSGGMEEDDYMGLEIPYLASNSMMSSVSELRLVQGFTPQILTKIKPYICVIPGDSRLKININTLDPEHSELLVAMLSGLSKQDAEALIAGAQPDGYETVQDMWDKSEMNRVEDKVKSEAIKYFDVTTQYFELKAQTSYGDSKFYLNSKLQLNQSKQVTVIARRFGVDL